MQDSARQGAFHRESQGTLHGVVAVDANGYVRATNPAAQMILGLADTNVLGCHVSEIGTDLGLTALLSGESVPPLTRVQVGERALVVERILLGDQSGGADGAIAVLHDLGGTETFLLAVIGAIEDAISIADPEGKGLMVNRAYTRLTGLSEHDVIGKPAWVDIAEGSSMHMQVLATGEPVKNVPMRVGPMGRRVVVSVDPVIVDGTLVGSVGVIRDVSEILRLTQELERTRKAVRRLQGKHTFDEVVSVNPLMSSAIEQAKRVAPTSETVLLRGECGTGKELIAHAIHSASPRSECPFVRVNCASLPGDLLEIELLGSALPLGNGERKMGLFEEASGGTLFIDEVGLISPELQVELLRVLGEKKILRVGEEKPRTVDVRVIASTNEPLERLVSEGRFREDLYYRLNVVPIFIPPLRQRLDDLPLLCDELIWRLNREYGRNVEKVGPEVMETFRNYRWPGNVRELENVIARAMMNLGVDDDTIESRRLPPMVGGSPEGDVQAFADAGLAAPFFGPLRETVEHAERTALAQALSRARGNKTRAARLLGISIRTLYNKMEKYFGEDGTSLS